MRKRIAVLLGVVALALPATAHAQDAPDVYTSFQAAHSLMCLDVLYWSKDPGAVIVQATCQGGENQKWSVQHVGTNGRFWLRNEWSQLCLHSPNGTEGTQLVQQPCTAGQTWDFAVDRAGLLIRSSNSGMCVDVFNFSQVHKDPVVQWRCNIGFTNQQWVPAG